MFVGNDRKITMNRETLLEKLRENLETHQQEYQKAATNWIHAVQVHAKELLERVSREDYSDLSFPLTRPKNSSTEIERAIDMVRYSVEEVIVLDEPTFRQWVSGEWSFRDRLHETMLSASAFAGSLGKKY